MIPEREREALMRLTMCARGECDICKYAEECDDDFQYKLATKNMNILADALRADRKTEPTGYNLSPVEDEPQTCETCRHWEYIAKEWQCETEKCQGYEPKTEPQRNMAEDIVESFGFKAESYRQAKAKTEPQTERSE